mmetsp:Transcript_17707/g.21654  ORF Transcript_17707/g.21654 Transcript_17707/m.21654 type:complete len:522 (+) Transcript_17707:76-1641(+)
MKDSTSSFSRAMSDDASSIHIEEENTLRSRDSHLFSSIASSSALVSESLIDPFPPFPSDESTSSQSIAEGSQVSQGTTTSRLSANQKPIDERGVNRHTYSPESIRRILEQQQNERSSQDRSDTLEGRSESNDDSVRTLTAFPAVASTFVGAAGYLSRWVHVQKIKRQKEVLERAVEDQRRILQKEALRLQEERRKIGHPRIDFSDDRLVNTGLKGNSTFQNITAAKRVTGLALCGVGSYNGDDDDDTDYQADFTSDGHMATIDNSDTEFLASRVHNTLSYDDCAAPIRIGDHCHSISGEGAGVKFELLDTPTPSPSREVKRKVRSDSNDEMCPKVQPEENSIPFILSREQMKNLAANGLPASLTFAKWNRMYSLQRDGDSFTSSFLKKVTGEQRTLLVVQTTTNEILGGYSNSPWENQGGSVGAAFYGSCQASLFKINKNNNQLEVFKWSGANRYIQVCDVHAKLIAFGGGGEEGAFGLCIEDDFSVGTTGKCETFNNEPLCDEGRFEIMNVECWGFMPGF